MKIGMCMLLWTTHVTQDHEALLRDIRATGFDGVEIPVFEGTPDDYARLAAGAAVRLQIGRNPSWDFGTIGR